MPDERATRLRVLEAGMELFGRQGYAGTTVAQIEQAAGLSPGGGGLYRHFRSKRALLEAGVDAALTDGGTLAELLGASHALQELPLPARLLVVARAGLERLRQGRDLNRLLLRDLAQFDDLLARVRDEEIRRTFAGLAAWLASQPEASRGVDWDAVAMVLMGAVSHFWIMTDTFGAHPSGLDADRYLRAAAALAVAAAGGTR